MSSVHSENAVHKTHKKCKHHPVTLALWQAPTGHLALGRAAHDRRHKQAHEDWGSEGSTWGGLEAHWLLGHEVVVGHRHTLWGGRDASIPVSQWPPVLEPRCGRCGTGGIWHKASVFGCLPLAAPISLSPLHILTLCGPERVLVVSTERPDDLSCLTTPGVGRPRDGLLPCR